MKLIFLLITRYNWIVLLLIIGFLVQSLKKEKSRADDLKAYQKIVDQELVTWKDKAGKSYAKAMALEIEARNVKEVLGKKKTKELRKEVGNVKKNLISYQKIKASTSGHVATTSKTYTASDHMDTLSIKKIDFSDPYFSASGFYNPTSDSILIDYKVRNQFEIFHYYERPGKPPFNIFRRKHAVVKIKFENQSGRVDKVFSFSLKRKDF